MDLIYVFQESLRGFKYSRWMSLASVIIIAINLLIIGGFLYVSINTNQIIRKIKEKVEIEVFVKDDSSQLKVAALQDTLLNISGVRDVQYFTKAMAWEEFKQIHGEEMLEAVEENPFPASFRLKLESASQNELEVQRIVTIIEHQDGIEEIKYGKQLLPLLDRFSRIYYTAFGVVSILISLIAVFIVSNTIKLTVFARQEIIRLMKLSGARDLYIRLPFILEGMIQGLLGATCAVMVLWVVIEKLKGSIAGFFIFPPQIMVVLFIFGFILGGCGSWVSLQKFLKL